jgi:hypothetical protein
MNTTSNFREWSRSQQRPTLYIKKKSTEEEYPPLVGSPVAVKVRMDLGKQGPAPSDLGKQGPAPSDLGKQGPSLAARIATAIKVDEQNIIARRVAAQPAPEPVQHYDLLPISQYGRLKFLSERKERAEREAASAAEEHEYRWQISREISREKFDREYGIEPMHLPDDLLEENEDEEHDSGSNNHTHNIQ